MNTLDKHKYTPLSEERFKEVLDLTSKVLNDEITIGEYSLKVSSEDEANASIQAQLKDYNFE